MKVSEKKLDLVDKIINDWKSNIYEYEEVIFDCVRELLQTKTITFLEDLYGVENDD